jgi:hypothetical protein
MFSKRWIKLIILLFLAMLIPLVFDSFVFDVVEGNVALATACAKGTGAVGACAKLKASTDEATKAQAKLMADLKKKADDKAKAAAPAAAKAKAAAPAVSKEESEEDSEIAELFTVNSNNQNDGLAYAYAIEPFYEGATTKKPVCKIIGRLDKMKKDSKKLEKYIDKLTTWSGKNCK